MRLCKIPNIDYKTYAKIADTIDTNIPFAIIDMRFNDRLKVGIFNFWDSDYIPEEMKKFIVQPPLSRENKEKMTKDLAELFK